MRIAGILQNNFVKTNPTFDGKAGQFINPAAKNQINDFTGDFEQVLKTKTPVMGQFDYLVRSIYPDLNFELKDISEVKNADIKERKPAVFLRSNFDSDEPKTIIYLNQDRFKEISEDSPETIHQYANRIGTLLAKKNEMNFISKIVNDCVAQFNKTKDFSIDFMNKFLRDIIKKYKLDIDVKAIDKNSLDASMNVGTHCTLNKIYGNGDLSSDIAININESESSIRRGFPHELHHVLNFNSIEFNQLFTNERLKNNAQTQHSRLEDEFIEILKNDFNFLKKPAKERNETYNKVFKKVFFNTKPQTAEQVELMAKVLEENVRDEAFTYEKTENLPANYYPIGDCFNDFYKYLLSVKYDREKREKLLLD